MRHLRIAVAGLEAHRPRALPRGGRAHADAICQGGIYDHLGGGYSRYSTDARWLVPHFEKMLYDNAELVEPADAGVAGDARPALRAARRRDDRLARARDDAPGGRRSTAASTPTASTRRASSTSGPRPRSTRCSATAPACSSAITTWPPAAIGKGQTILNRLAHQELADDATEARAGALPRAAARGARGAGAARARRQGAGGLERADDRGAGRGRAGVRAAGMGRARRARLRFHHRQDDAAADGRLRHSWRDGRARHPASVDDYANLCRAALALHEATGDDDPIWRRRGNGSTVLDRHYWDEAGGGYFFAADDTADLIARVKIGDRCGGAVRQRHDGRGLDPAGALDRRRRLSPPRRGDRRRLLRRARPQFLPARDADQQHRIGAKAELQIVLAGNADDCGVSPNCGGRFIGYHCRTGSCRRCRPMPSLPESHPAHGKGLVERQGRRPMSAKARSARCR